MNKQFQTKLKCVLNNFSFFYGTIQKQYSRTIIAMLSKSQHPIQKEVRQGIWSHMKVWDPGAELIKDESTDSALSLSAITWTCPRVKLPNGSALR